jgi:hypothetical protein
MRTGTLCNLTSRVQTCTLGNPWDFRLFKPSCPLTKRHARLDLVDENVRRDRRCRSLVLHLARRDELFLAAVLGRYCAARPVPKAWLRVLPTSFQRLRCSIVPILQKRRKRSTAYLCEGDLPLGPAHAQHGEIDTLGRGSFSHYSTYGFIFSTSDNSDPNKNGRTYMAIQP